MIIEPRNGVAALSSELTDAVSQIQVNASTWTVESKSPTNLRKLFKQDINTVQPKGILIIGDSAEMISDEAKNTFELYRRNLHNPDVITYDELLKRAQYIVNGASEKANHMPSFSEQDGLPF